MVRNRITSALFQEVKGLKQNEVAKELGIFNTTLSNYEREARKPELTTLISLAELYEVSLDWLVHGGDLMLSPSIIPSVKNLPPDYRSPCKKNGNVFKIPILKHIYSDANDLFDINNIERFVYIDEESSDIDKDEEVFGMKIQDDSMEPRYQVGDIVLIKKTPRVGEGKTALVLIRNHQAAIRNVLEMGDDHILLFATNPKWPPQRFNMVNIRAIGKVGVRMG